MKPPKQKKKSFSSLDSFKELKSSFLLWKMMTDKELWSLYRTYEFKCFQTDIELNAFLVLRSLEPPVTMEQVWNASQSPQIVAHLMGILNAFEEFEEATLNVTNPKRWAKLIEEIASKIEGCFCDHYDGPDLAEACYILTENRDVVDRKS